jgi:hypothetical protein
MQYDIRSEIIYAALDLYLKELNVKGSGVVTTPLWASFILVLKLGLSH